MGICVLQHVLIFVVKCCLKEAYSKRQKGGKKQILDTVAYATQEQK
jgi:hypothetical protein